MHKRKKLDHTGLFISGTSSPYKCIPIKISSNDYGDSRKVSATPDSKRPYIRYSTKSSNRCFVKKKKRLGGFTEKHFEKHSSFYVSNPKKTELQSNLRPVLLLQQRIFARHAKKISLLNPCVNSSMNFSMLPKRSSSKGFQVDFQETMLDN